MPKDPRRSGPYRRERAAYMAQHPVCEWCNRAPARTLHHKIPLSMGGELIDKDNFMALCSPCHTHLNKNPMLTIFGD